MNTTTGRRRLALWQSLLLVLGVLVVVPMFGNQQTARAAVTAGEIVFGHYCSGYRCIGIRDSGGDVTNIASSTDYSSPDMSPDGSRIAFVKQDGTTGSHTVHVMNSDGSGVTRLVLHNTESGVSSSSTQDMNPRWSHDGQWIVFTRTVIRGWDTYYSIDKVRADGTDHAELISDLYDSPHYVQNLYPVWSPDGSKIAFTSNRDTPSLGFRLIVMDSDGDNDHLASSETTLGTSSLNEMYPNWSPDGSRIYFVNAAGSTPIAYLSSTDDFASSDATGSVLLSAATASSLHLSADGDTLVFVAFYTSACDGPSSYSGICLLDTGTGDTTQISGVSGLDSNSDPSFVPASWPPTPPSNSDVALSAPSPSDDPYTRQITINLSTSGVEKFQYGWSTSDSTAPNTSYLQESTDLTTPKMGTLNYLGKYSGGGTTWNGGATPNSDWYLWVRSVQTGGTPNSWATPLLVNTPRRPVWVGLGDSYSSGHHQDSDLKFCPDPTDSPWGLDYESYWNCGLGGLDVTPNDLDYSWVKEAVDNYNTALHAPSSWSYGLDLEAESGAWTSAFGVSGTTPGTDSWASGTAQSAAVRADLYAGYNSWPVVSMTGGGNDAGLKDRLGDFYHLNFVAGSPAPWDVSTFADCPDSQQMWEDLHAEQLDSQTLDEHIQGNLQGVVAVAANYAPGVRVLNLGYPYIVDSTNVCSSDHDSGTWHGFQSVVDDLNNDHAAVTGDNVHYIDLTDPGTEYDFGTSPVTSGYLQLTRLYGYPHPSDDGQTQIADAVIYDLNHGW